MIYYLRRHIRQVSAFLWDAVIAHLSVYISLYLRHGNWSFIHYDGIRDYNLWIFFSGTIIAICFLFSGLYRGIWRFSSVPDLKQVVKGVSIGVFCSFLFLFFTTRLLDIPRSLFIIEWLFLIVTLGGSRFAYRIWKDTKFPTNGKRVLIIGAGDSGEKLYRAIRNNPELELYPIGFVDFDPLRKGRTIHGIPVLGSIENLSEILLTQPVEKAFIAVPDISGSQMREIVNICLQYHVQIKTLPKWSSILGSKIDTALLRNVTPEDLLGRDSVQLNTDSLKDFLSGKVIMVTGAGGSIGSEICRQIAQFSPSLIVLYELTELFLYEIEMELQEKFPHIRTVAFIGDVRDPARVKCALKSYSPQVVFHAAAYKHVPMMEKNPFEAIQTNVGGSSIMASECSKHGVEAFVLISTDKAVNPTSIMGATKRIAELQCQRFQSLPNNQTKFITVRFGNVLGSSGSVIPLFKKQIEQGGPITVTHPDIKRYFMSIPEATQLVIQAGAMGKGGEIFILDMGEPVKIVDLAKQMIALAGLRENKDIEIKFTGIRRGEKLFEELLLNDEKTLATAHPMVRVARANQPPRDLEEKINKLFNIQLGQPYSDFMLGIKEIVPEYILGSFEDHDDQDSNKSGVIQ